MYRTHHVISCFTLWFNRVVFSFIQRANKRRCTRIYLYTPLIMESLNSYSVVDEVRKHCRLKNHSEEAHKEQTKLQHQQVVLGLDKTNVLQQKDKGK